jgi:hypothetical protein
VDRAALWQVFSKHFGFPCHFFHELLHTHHHLLSRVDTNSQIVATVLSEFSLTPTQETEGRRKKTIVGVPFYLNSLRISNTRRLTEFVNLSVYKTNFSMVKLKYVRGVPCGCTCLMTDQCISGRNCSVFVCVCVPIIDNVFCIVVSVSMIIDLVCHNIFEARVGTELNLILMQVLHILTVYKFSLLSDQQGQSML